MKIKGVDFAAYVVSDLKRSIDFYQNTLGLKLTSQGDIWAEFDCGNLTLVIGMWEGSKVTTSGAGLAFSVDDVKKTVAELQKKGVKLGKNAWDGESCLGASVLDPDGNSVYFHHRMDGTVG